MSAARIGLLSLAMLAFFGGQAVSQPPAGSVPSDSAAAKEAGAQVEKTMKAFAAMNVADFKAGLAEDVTAFEFDMDGKPVRLRGRDDALRFAEETFAQGKKMGASFSLDIHRIECHAAALLAYCTVEFDFKATMPDGSQMIQPTRNSFVLSKEKDGWRWAHWHSSLLVTPAPVAPAAQ